MAGFDGFVRRALALPLGAKAAILLGLDAALIPAALALTARLLPGAPGPAALLPALPALMIFGLGLSLRLGVCHTRLRDYEIQALGQTALFSLGLAAALKLALGGTVGNEAAALFGIAFFFCSALTRIAIRQGLGLLARLGAGVEPVLIYGAGTTGLQAAAALRRDERLAPAAFLDDRAALQGLKIGGLRVHPPERLAALTARTGARRAIIAIPSLSPSRRAEIAAQLRGAGLAVTEVPAFAELLGGARERPFEPEGLIDRRQVNIDHVRLGLSYAGRTILVSGAGGSIGSEICRQVLAAGPNRLVLVDISEPALFAIERDLAALSEASEAEIVPVLGSAGDAALMRRVFAEHAVDVVLHAAAYKHVPLVEANAAAGLANNALATHVLAKAAQGAGVDRFILISTDKAVDPESAMGATKRLAELFVQDLAARSARTRFAVVRFGNVLGSSGSVIPIFRAQIAWGRPVTLTHPDATRYFMTVEEAVRLVLVAGAATNGGEIFVLDMGAPVRIAEIARRMIEASGRRVRDADCPEGEIEIRVTGLRPGERLHEPRMTEGARPSGVHPAILTVETAALSEFAAAGLLKALREALARGDDDAARAFIESLRREGVFAARAPEPPVPAAYLSSAAEAITLPRRP